MDDMEKYRQVEEARLKQPFLKRNRIVVVGLAGIIALHIGWYKLVETYVAEDDKPTYFPYPLLRKLDLLKNAEAKK